MNFLDAYGISKLNQEKKQIKSFKETCNYQ